jgi:hypothetical protein
MSSATSGNQALGTQGGYDLLSRSRSRPDFLQLALGLVNTHRRHDEHARQAAQPPAERFLDPHRQPLIARADVWGGLEARNRNVGAVGGSPAAGSSSL